MAQRSRTTIDGHFGVAAPPGGAPQLGRRAMVVGAVWSVPAVAMMSTSPAFATSGRSVSVSTSDMQVPASGAVAVTAAVSDASGAAVPGTAVSFSGTTGATFTPATSTTDGAGLAVTQLDLGTPWATPGSSTTVTALSGADSTSASLTVLGANLVVAGKGYTSSFTQTERVFPSPVVDALAMGTFGVAPWYLALLADGTVWSKGNNKYGQLGDGSQTDRSTWAKVRGVSDAVGISAGNVSAYVLLSDGSVRAWGRNNDGQLGDGSSTNRSAPVAVSGLSSGVVQIAGGVGSGYARRSDGSVVAWGNNSNGALGDGSTTYRTTPVAVSGLSGAIQIAAGSYSGYVLLSDGSVKAWGYNIFSQLGDGSTTNRSTPVPVSGLSSGVSQIAAGGVSAYALTSGGSVKAWGENGDGRLGDGSWTSSSVPVQVSGLTSGVSAIAAATSTAYALLTSGSLKAWGANVDGAVGDGTTADRNTPVPAAIPAGRVVRRLGGNSPVGPAAMVVLTTS